MEYVKIKLETFESKDRRSGMYDFYFTAESDGDGLIKLEIAGKKFEFNSEGKLIKGNIG